MTSLPIKILKDEQKEPFIPFTNIDAVYKDSQTTLQDVLDTKLEASDIQAGTNITITTSGNEVTINATGGSQVTLIDDLNTTTANQGALDAHQGYVLKGMIPTVIDDDKTPINVPRVQNNIGNVIRPNIYLVVIFLFSDIATA